MIMSGSQRRRQQPHSAGFIVVAALWILSALATLALIYSTYLGDSTISLSVNDERIASETLVSAGVELAAYRLLAAQKDKRPTRGGFAARLGGANMQIDFISEAARIDLNAAPKQLLSGLFSALGARTQDAGEYADRVIGWRSPPKQGAQDTETGFYRAAGLSYSPRGAPFAHVSELRLVAGLPPALVERAMPFVTVFSGRADVDALDAAPEVIAALPPAGSGPGSFSSGAGAAAQNVPSAGAGGQSGGSATQGGDAFRVQVRVAFDNGQRAASEVVILLDGQDEPYHVLAWGDEVAPLPPLRLNSAAPR
jgi:general secretion pathway protein K